MGQLAMVNYDANPTVPKTFYTYRPPVLDELKAPPGSYRFLSQRLIPESSSATNPQAYVNLQSVPDAQSFSGIVQGSFQSRLQLYTGSMLYHVEGSISVDPEGSVPDFFYDLKARVNDMDPDSVRFNCLLGRINVKYIIRPTAADTSVTRLISNVFNGSTVPSRLYEDLCFVPRTYVAGNSLFSTNEDGTLDHLASPDFDALNTAILAAPPGSSPSVSGAGSAGQAEIVRREPNSITLRAQLARPGYVLLLDRYDTNWQATLDGRPAPVLRANQIFRAVYADAGSHEIRFDYRQRGLAPGLAISLLALAGLIALSFCKVEI
jgi:hypothetical protein